MNFELLDIINFIAIFQLSVFVFFLLTKKTNRLSNKILAAFLFIQIFIILNFEFFRFYEYISPHFIHTGTPFISLAAPTFYLYIKSMVFKDFRFERKYLVHALPFLLVVLFFIFSYHIYSGETKRELLFHSPLFSQNFWDTYNICLTIQLSIYFIVDFKILGNYRREIKQQFSSVKNINLTWLQFILYCFMFSWLTNVAAIISGFYFTGFLKNFMTLDFFSFLIFFNYIFYKGLSQPEIFSGIEEKPRYTTSKLSTRDAEAYLNKLESYMGNEKPYLNPNLTLKELSAQITIPARYLSQVINEYKNLNFYDYISSYRIQEAKTILSDPEKDYTVLEVLYNVGFNSKSSFNTAFKKFTGTTPSHFKKKPDTVQMENGKCLD